MKISRFLLNLWGWKIENILPDVSKCVIALAPHTSNWDFVIGKLAYSSIGRNARFLIKKEWFVFPFNLLFKSMGGIPIERNKKQSMTDTLAEEFDKHEDLQLAITPEGTRKRVPEWRRGFYYIALKARVPILLIALDYKKKAVVFLDLFYPTGDYEADLVKIKSYYKGVHAKNPKNFNPI
ncbi:MAG TPA: acyltransferase [Porphyromonadaceae bacterium]|jgi:1-acyl-sn-glycerol-3-phosphate acyltransferase|nr:acyltransferase [Porphyromonadaceae bacterium]HBK32502.1 acyltransferase [Porphyromonadaceae bacterium]HBL35008.1 acyltransferase [Porphyromonadaceae bacterium]HBX19227.1 acyltransferase [Porphyromonadaceae bacterium]HCM21007.1 acyltransferase [Porphyromonadaceae bacterium]